MTMWKSITNGRRVKVGQLDIAPLDSVFRRNDGWGTA